MKVLAFLVMLLPMVVGAAEVEGVRVHVISVPNAPGPGPSASPG